jgi:hypothetical protein
MGKKIFKNFISDLLIDNILIIHSILIIEIYKLVSIRSIEQKDEVWTTSFSQVIDLFLKNIFLSDFFNRIIHITN